jgi:hypothetical protein
MEADMELQMPDGRVYTGKVRNGKPHGRGVMRWKDGTRYAFAFIVHCSSISLDLIHG